MNNLLKYGLPSLLALAMATPAMAQNSGYNGQADQSSNGQSYGQNGNSGPNSWNNGQTYGQNGSYGNNGQTYGQDGRYGNNGQNYGQAGGYGNNGQNYGQNGNSDNYRQNYSQNSNYSNSGQNGNYGNSRQNYSQNGSYGQNFPQNSGNEDAVTRGFMAHVQHRLQQEGFYNSGNIDGLWGPNTQSALQNFQQQHNLRVTGQIDMQTLAALDMMQGGNRMNGQQYGQDGNYQTYNRGNNQAQSYTSNSTGNNRSGGYGDHVGYDGASGQMNR